AAEYFDPEDPQSIAEAITRLTHAERWAGKSAAGQVQALAFDWARSADSLVELIRSVAPARTADS
ncbi:MAG: glycosyltransferase family 1 protein, partial [Brevibacterium linens]